MPHKHQRISEGKEKVRIMLTPREEQWVKDHVAAADAIASHETAVEARRLRVIALKQRLRTDPQYSREQYATDLGADPEPVKPAPGPRGGEVQEEAQR